MKKITSSQMGSLIYLISLSSCLGNIANFLINMSKQDSWISIIIAAIIGLFFFTIILKIIEYKPDLNIFEKNIFLFGKFIGNLINILLVLMFMLIAIAALWDLNNFISSQYLHLTPSFLIGIFMIITIIYMLTKDLYVMARTCFILFIIGFSLYLLGFIGLITEFKFSNIMPILENGFGQVMRSGLLSVSYDILPLFVLTVIPKNKMNIEKLSELYKWFFLAGTAIFIIILLTIGIFGFRLASLYEYSVFHLLKNISLFGFINRVESIISLRWIFYLITLILMSVYFGIEYIKKVFKINNKKITNLVIILVCTIIFIVSEKIFINSTQKVKFMTYYFPYFSWLILGLIPLIIFIFSKLKKAR